MRWTGLVLRMGEMRSVYNILVEKSQGNRPLRKPDADGNIILEWILGK